MANPVRQPLTSSVMSALRAAWPPAAATTIAFLPQFLWDLLTNPGALLLTYVGVLLLAAPITAYVTNRRKAVATDALRSLVIAAPQVPLFALLVPVSVWIEVLKGNMRAGSSEVAMSLGISTPIVALFGLILVAPLVALAARLGARRS